MVQILNYYPDRTPTEPGYYWFTEDPGITPHRFVEVVLMDGVLYGRISQGNAFKQTNIIRLDTMTGFWSERLEPPRYVNACGGRPIKHPNIEGCPTEFAQYQTEKKARARRENVKADS